MKKKNYNSKAAGSPPATSGIRETRRIDAELRSLSDQLNSLSGNMAQGLVYQVTCSPDLSKRWFSYVSPALERLHGLKVPDLQKDYMLIYNQFIEEDRALVAQRELEAFRTMTKLDVEARMKLPSGEIRWRHFISAPRLLDNGNVVWDGIELDITDRKLMEDALRKSENDYRTMVETTEEWIWKVDRDGYHTFSNRGITVVLGYPQNELIGKQSAPYLHEDDLREVESKFPRFIADKQGWRGWILRWLHKDGTYRYLESNASPLIDSEGECVGYVGADRDVTASKVAAETLSRQNEQLKALQSLIDQSDSMAFVWRNEESKWPVEYVSNNVEQILGYSASDFMSGRISWPEVTYPEDLPRLEKEVAEYLGNGERKWSQEYRLITKSGEIRWFRDNNLALTDQAGNVIKVQAVIHDITKFIKAEEELNRQREHLIHVERVFRMGELAASIAHEINQPLMGILSNAQSARKMLARDGSNLEEVREMLSNIVADEKRASAVIQHLRALLKKDDSYGRDIDINKQIVAVMKIIESDMALKNVSLSATLRPDIPAVHADPVQIQQVLLNLIMNAQQAMEGSSAKKKITLTTSVEQDGRVHVCVEDNGPGVDKESLEHIFEPFHSTKPDGMGMGLAICRSIIDAFDGKIWVDQRPKAGARFCFSLPIVNGDGA